MNEFLYFLINVLLVLGTSATDIGCKSHATVFRQLEREGFHVDINYLIELVVNLETAEKWKRCSLVLRENITDSFYVNPDQLSELNRSGISQACTTDKVDVEAPRHLSKPHFAYVYGQLERSHNSVSSRLHFPLHLRYQKPKPNGGYAKAELKLPLLLIRCPNIECKNLQKSMAPCSQCGAEMCVWSRLPYKTNNNNMTLPVPVGNLSHLWFVKPVTYFLTFGACCYVLLAIFVGTESK